MATGNSYKLKDNQLTFGRNMTSDVILDTDRFTSREHAKIVKENNEYTLIDLGSTNGTYLNGQKISEPMKLNRGDIIRIGSNEFICNFN
jgi:pSer/pThr/pTyr-binding forkhead associated (FHA) protein